tara:strand:- start:795 stop:2153 length:1359 start_codon:yes stop_codon:yes gene_type:complete
MKKDFYSFLEGIFDKKDIETEEDNKYFYSKDWSNLKPSEPVAVVFPREIKQLKEVVKLCNEQNQPFIGSGGRTGLSGGATCLNNELVISFEKMNKIIDFDHSDNTILCEPGLVTENLQNFATENELFYPVNFSSVGSSQIGGNISTNAGGIKVIKYGLTKNYVKGLSVITGDGKDLDFDNRLVKDATGPKLGDLFIGSEGIFGLIKTCRMKLIKKPPPTKLAFISFSEIEKLIEVRNLLFKSEDIEAVEFLTKTCMQKVKDAFKHFSQPDVKGHYFIILEFTGNSIETDLNKLILKKIVDDIFIVETSKQKKNIWNNRLLISESINDFKPLKFDVSVPLSKFECLVQNIERLVKKFSKVEPILFGHVGDGNLHINLIGKDDLVIDNNLKDKLTTEIYKIILGLKGSISAEHGIGYLKKKIFLEQANKEELHFLKATKKFYDPLNVLNPGKLI